MGMNAKMKKKILIFAVCAVLGCSLGVFIACNVLGTIKKDVTIEAGTPLTLDVFFDIKPADCEFLTDVSGIDTNKVAVYQLKIRYGSKQDDVVLRIEDHTAPVAEAVPMTVYMNWKMPEPEECVTNVYDLSGIAKIEYQDGSLKFTAGGEFQVPVVITDMYGNQAVINVPFTIVNDTTPPVISGVHELELEGNPDSIEFFEGVTVTDDYDPAPVITVDDSEADYAKAGTYKITYRAIDKAGNIGTAETTITVKIAVPEAEKKNKVGGDNGTYHVGDGDPYALARKVMSGLYRSNDVETARAIFNWVHDNFYFRLLSGKRVYEHAAYRGFTKKSGDCYVYWACCKMLLDLAGIENMRVERYPKRNGQIHYWLLVKLNGEWYHCDATEGYKDHPGVWFMCTDAQINDKYHKFNGKLYPARAGGSKDFLASPTPTPAEEITPSPTPTTPTEPTDGPTDGPTAGPTSTNTPTPVTVPDNPTPTPTEAPAKDTPTPTPEDTPKPTPVTVPDTPTPVPQTNTPTTAPETGE